MARDPGHERDQRRLIDIAPGQMFSAREVIEFIAKISVVIGSGELDEKFAEGEKGEQALSEARLTHARASICTSSAMALKGRESGKLSISVTTCSHLPVTSSNAWR